MSDIAENMSAIDREHAVDFGRAGKPTPHGTENGYRRYGCRCDDCRHEHARYNRERYLIRQGRRLPPVKEIPFKSTPFTSPPRIEQSTHRNRGYRQDKGGVYRGCVVYGRMDAVDDEQFRAIYQADDGQVTKIARRIGTSVPSVRERARALGLQPFGYLNVVETARLLDISRDFVMKLIAQGTLAASSSQGRRKLRQWRITPRAVQEIKPRIPRLRTAFREIPPGYLSIRQVAELFRLRENTIVLRCERGQLQAVQNPAHIWLIPIDQPLIQVALTRTKRSGK